jgi:hypothetical protein
MDRREQVFFTEGFEQESDCTVVHCPSPGLTAGLGGDKNDRDLVTRGNELSLQIQTARVGGAKRRSGRDSSVYPAYPQRRIGIKPLSWLAS